MRLENVGSQYLAAYLDNKDIPFDGGKTYKVTLPPNIPAARFWSFTCMTINRAPCWKHRSSIHVREARLILRPQQNLVPMDQPRYTLGPHSPMV